MRQRQRTAREYGRAMVLLHWTSAIAILAMIPLGFLMQDASDASKLLLYRAHVGLGLLVLVLTLWRVVSKLRETMPTAPPGLSGVHLRGMQAIHALLYAALFVLTASGFVLMTQSGLAAVLRGTPGPIPELGDFRARAGHAAVARVFIALLIAHIGGVIIHQLRYGKVFARMGVGRLSNSSSTPRSH